jgi:hypothetical protein
MHADTIVIIVCGINGCTENVYATYDPGEAQTRDYPGYPGRWIAESHTENDNEYHLERIDDGSYDNAFQARCQLIAAMCWDNVYGSDYYGWEPEWL